MLTDVMAGLAKVPFIRWVRRVNAFKLSFRAIVLSQCQAFWRRLTDLDSGLNLGCAASRCDQSCKDNCAK